MAVVHFLAAAIQMPQHGREVDAGGIHQLFFGKIESRANGQQLAANGADLRIHLPGFHQRLDEILQQQDVRIQRQHPFAAAKPDGLVLRRREPDILIVVIDPAAVCELFQNIDGAVSRGVVDDDHFEVRILLFQDRFKAPLDESAAVVGHDRDGD